MVTAPQSPRASTAPDTDQRIQIHSMSWAQFEAMLAARGDAPVPRMAYADETIELMSPSHRHEDRKSLLGVLVEAYIFERDLYFAPWGATTLTNPALQKGVEPDESYALSRGASRPDLVIEAVLTSGGLPKLKIYAALEIPEVWLWFETGLEAYGLEDGEYVRLEDSRVLPGLSIAVVDRYARMDEAHEAIRAFRAALRAG